MANDEKLLKIISHYRKKLQKKIAEREYEMQQDNNDHYMHWVLLIKKDIKLISNRMWEDTYTNMQVPCWKNW